MNVNRKIVAISLARAIQAFGISFLIVILPLYVSGEQIGDIVSIGDSYIGIDVTTELLIGVAISITPLISSLSQPLSGRLSDRYKRRKQIIMLGIVLFIFTIPGYLLIESYWIVLGLRALQGISLAIIVPSSASLINVESDSDTKGENFGFYNTFRLVGFGIGPIVSGGIISLGPYSVFSISLTGIEAAFLCTFLAGLLSLVIIFIFVEERKEEDNSRSTSDLKQFISSSRFQYLIILGLVNFLLAASIAVFVTLENSLSQRFNQSSFMFGLQFSAAVLANTISQTPVGRLSDSYGRKPLILVGFVILIPAITAQGFVVTGNQMLIARVVQGISVALVFAPSLALAGDLARDENSGLFLSGLTGSFQLGIALGPTVSGVLISVGSFSTPFIFSGIVSSIGLVLVYIYLPDE